ncbi:MAG: RpiB/LacA/LacB family sugar-phosphate isomerase [Oscillospiraceae bacterium]|nr:RpiB/LacA/LacB family sugar-phosphate isomerase [Oscillospiraceae bacterium]
MRIGVIQASSQSDKNELLYRATCDAVRHNGRTDTVKNYGAFPDDTQSFTYIEAAINISLLLSSGAADLVVTGCSSGQGMMLACNSLPSVLCGYAPTPQDAFLFGRINGGNAVSLPLGLNFGWLGEINMQLTLDKLFEGEFGCGYPPADAERKRRDTEYLKQISTSTKLPLREAILRYDKALVAHALTWESVRRDIMDTEYRDILSLYA